MKAAESTPATMVTVQSVGRGASRLDERLQDALAFKAPYVIDRLVKDRAVDTAVAAEKLFTEAKKYLVLKEVTRDMTVGMHSAMVDEAWHAFILFTAEYADYCHGCFGRYVNHAPIVGREGSEQAPEPDARPSDHRDHSHGTHRRQGDGKVASFDAFRQRYEARYDQPLPDIWYDINSIVLSRRVISDKAGLLTIAHHDHIIDLIDDSGATIVSVNDVAYPALNFVIETTDFYVRELPGNLTDDEKIGLTQALTQARVLRLAP